MIILASRIEAAGSGGAATDDAAALLRARGFTFEADSNALAGAWRRIDHPDGSVEFQQWA